MKGKELNLSRIEARLKAATPGPWNVFDQAGVLEVQKNYDSHKPIIGWMGFDNSIRPMRERRAIANFVAHAPADIAALVAEVKRLRSMS